MRQLVRYEVFLPLGAGGSFLKSYKSLEEAKAYDGAKDFTVYRSVYGVTDRGTKFRVGSKRVF